MRGLVALATVISLTGAARAEACPVPDDSEGALAAVDAEARLAFIETALLRERSDMLVWKWAWAGVFAAGLGGGTVLGIVFDRPDMYVTAVKAGAGLLSIPILSKPSPVVPARTGDLCADLAAAERELARSARAQRNGRGWLIHVAGVAANVAGVLYLGLRHGRWLSGSIGAVSGLAIGEFKIYTQPIGAIRDRERYRRGQIRGVATGQATMSVAPVVVRRGLGLVVSGTF